jgi:ABC-type phosphate/phosphonate transport system permease subunit
MRIMRTAARELYDVLNATTRTHRVLRDRLVFVAVVSIAIDLVCALLALMLERHAPGSDVKSYGSALFWTSTQLLTVSSQFRNPISDWARVLDVLMEAYAITIVATLAGTFGAFFHRRANEREQEEAAASTAAAG